MKGDKIAKSWEELTALSADVDRLISRAEAAWGRGVAVFGAGPCGQSAARYLEKIGARVLCFADNDPVKQGAVLGGIRVVPPYDAVVAAASAVFIAVRRDALSVRQQLASLGIDGLLFDAFYAVTNRERFAHVRNSLLVDDRSKLSYDGILKTILSGDSSFCAAVMEGDQYFALPEFVNIGNDHFVDAGAYVGDTTEKFIWTCSGVFSRIYAFEPGAPQMTAMKHRIERLCREWAISGTSIICEPAALSDKDQTAALSMPDILARTSLTPDGTGDGKQPVRVCCYALDSYLAGRPATFIKADIEGMELAMLHGARETIQRYRPKMAISIYHTPAHLFEIAEYINRLVPEYRMAVRQHSPIFAESVLYCWMPQAQHRAKYDIESDVAQFGRQYPENVSRAAQEAQ